MTDPFSDNPESLKRKGDEYFREGEYHKAIQFYQRALELDPSSIKAWNNLGYSYIKLGQKEEAVQCIRKIKKLEASRMDPTTLNNASGETINSFSPNSEGLKEEGLRESFQPAIGISVNDESGINYQNKIGTVFKNIWPRKSENNGKSEIDPGENQGKRNFLENIFALSGAPEGIIQNDTETDSVGTTMDPRHKSAGFGGIISYLWSPGMKEKLLGFNGRREHFSDAADDFKKAIVISIIIGMCLMVFLLFIGSNTERFTQFYLYPDSIQASTDSDVNISSFTYGVKSYEHEDIQYELMVYAGSDLVDMETFSLNPGETHENKITFDYSAVPIENPQKIYIILKSPYQTYELHYWIKK